MKILQSTLSDPKMQHFSNNTLLKNMKLEADIKDLKVITWETEEENFIIKMEGIIKANGRIIKWIGTVNYIIKVVN